MIGTKKMQFHFHFFYEILRTCLFSNVCIVDYKRVVLLFLGYLIDVGLILTIHYSVSSMMATD